MKRSRQSQESIVSSNTPTGVDHGRRQFLRWAPVPAVAMVAACGGGGTTEAGPTAQAQQDTRQRALALSPDAPQFNPVGKGGLMILEPASRNFELLLPSVDGHLITMRRLNDFNHIPWQVAVEQGMSSAGTISGASQIYSKNFKNMEAVVVDGGVMRTYFRGANGGWGQPPDIAGVNNAQGTPGFIQALMNNELRFHVVVGVASGGFVHLQRIEGTNQWEVLSRFGSGQVRGVALIQGNYVVGGNANFEMVAWVNNDLQGWYYQEGRWTQNAVVLSGNVGGAPALIQSTHGKRGNLEALVPLASGGMAHYFRDNDNTGRWFLNKVFGSGNYRAAGLLQGQYGDPGHLEAACVRGDEVDTFFMDDTAAWRSLSTLAPLAAPGAAGSSFRLDDVGVTGINATLLHDGRVLLYGFPKGGIDGDLIAATVWNPSTRATQSVQGFRNNFCSGQTTLPDGRVVIAGGHVGSTMKDLVLFDPTNNQATRVAEMQAKRWYPTVAPLADGSVVILGGSRTVGWFSDAEVEATWQTYHPSRGLSANQPVPKPFSPHFPPGQQAVDLYPYMALLPNGDMLIHSRNTTRFLHVPTGTWRTTMHRTVSRESRTYPFAGSFALLPLRPADDYRVRLLVSGGMGGNADLPIGTKDQHSQLTLAMASAELLDLGGTTPGWRSVADMKQARFMHNLVGLPDGTVFCVGGNVMGHADVGRGPTLLPELYDPAANTWTTLPACRVARGYHATALLLPDGRVMIAGKDGDVQTTGLQYAENRVEIYTPPYLTRGARPSVALGQKQWSHGGTYLLDLLDATVSSQIGSVMLVACGSTTHSVEFAQRIVELSVTRVGDRQLRLVAPPTSSVAPPGGYMLFAMSTNSVPSMAQMVRLTGADTLASVSAKELGSNKHMAAVSLDDAGAAPRCVPPTVAQVGRAGSAA